jgi:hypothetical protein
VHRDPDDAAVLGGRGDGGATGGGGRADRGVLKRERLLLLGRDVARLGLSLERELTRLLGGDHPRDLALDRRVQPLLAGELRADARLRRRSRRDESPLRYVLADERMLVRRHRLLEADDLVHHRDVLVRDRLHRLDAVDEILDARRAEDDAERRLILARRVDRDETRHQCPLRPLEVRTRRLQCDLVDEQVVLDLTELHRRHLVAVARALEIRVELLDLSGDALRLRALRADGRVAHGRAGREKSRSRSEHERRRQSLQSPMHELRPSLATGAPGWGRYSTSSGG